MLKLYFSKGSSALAAHILLNEIGAPFETREVPIASNAHKLPEFLAINPKGRLPALRTEDGIITETPAILEFIAARYPDRGFLPETVFAQAQARSLCAYLCATVHVAFAHGKRADRWAGDLVAQQAMQAMVRPNLSDCAATLDRHLLQGPWALGSRYSYCDPYLFLVGRWMAAHDLSLEPFPGLHAHALAMRQRSATRLALAAHDLDNKSAP